MTTITSVPEALQAIRREIVDPAPLLHHPVVQARIKGELTLDQIRAIDNKRFLKSLGKLSPKHQEKLLENLHLLIFE